MNLWIESEAWRALKMHKSCTCAMNGAIIANTLVNMNSTDYTLAPLRLHIKYSFIKKKS